MERDIENPMLLDSYWQNEYRHEEDEPPRFGTLRDYAAWLDRQNVYMREEEEAWQS